jgi:ribonuclease HI
MPTGSGPSADRGEDDLPGVRVHFDGACQTIGGRRIAAYGFWLEGEGGLRHEEWGLAVPPGHPRATNNVAEYVAAIRPLEWLVARPYSGDVEMIGDSQLVVRQVTGEYRVREEHLTAYHARLAQLVSRFRRVEFRWVRREENPRADLLSKRAIEAALDRPRTRSSPGDTGSRETDADPGAPTDQFHRTV